MSRPRKVDTATSADWGFLEDEDFMSTLRNMHSKRSGRFGADADDVWQDLLLHLSVRDSYQRGIALGVSEARWFLHRRMQPEVEVIEYEEGADVREG